MPKIAEIAPVLESLAPLSLAEEWDNVGLLVGDPDWPGERVMTCLTITPDTVREAVAQRANLIVSHHPLPFRPLKSITSETTPGRLLLELISARVGVYSAHTAFDSAPAGVNQHLALGLGLQEIRPLAPLEGEEADVGAGRCGLSSEPQNLRELAESAKGFLNVDSVRVVGPDDRDCTRVGIACGSGGSFLAAAAEADCDAFVTGETTFHTCLEAQALGIGLVLTGHYASERFALASLADYLNEQIPGVQAWASRDESDPLRTI